MNKGLKSFGQKIKYIPKLYSKTIEPYLGNIIKISIVQPFRSIIRYHHLKKAYNQKYRLFFTFCKAFLIPYWFFSFVNYDIALSSLVGKQKQKTQYAQLVRRASLDSGGADKIQYSVKQIIEKGKKSGLLSIQLNQLAYLLEPYQVAWQGRYLSSLKS